MDKSKRPFTKQEFEYYMNLSEDRIRNMSDDEFIRFQTRRQELIKEANRRGINTTFVKPSI